jgi:hypothetical protein
LFQTHYIDYYWYWLITLSPPRYFIPALLYIHFHYFFFFFFIFY